MGVSAKKRKGMKAVIIMDTPYTKSLGGGSGGTRGREDVRGAKIAGRSPPFLGWEREASVLMLIRSAAARATMRPVLLLSSAS